MSKLAHRIEKRAVSILVDRIMDKVKYISQIQFHKKIDIVYCR